MQAPLVGLTTAQIVEQAVLAGFPAFRGRQIASWIYKKNVIDPARMTDLPKAISDWLTPETLGIPSLERRTDSPDGTVKLLLELQDSEQIETVLLPYPDRTSLCISSQVGCPMGCVFCATGASGYSRNLSASEIVSQYVVASSISTSRISHVVVMGMGEPLLNTENVLAGLRVLQEELGLSARHITISTVGIPDQIVELAKLKLQYTLAVSLHAPNQELREQLLPAASAYPLSQLLESCKLYSRSTRRRLTYEYLLIEELNDLPEHAAELARLMQCQLCQVNLIPYNPVAGCSFKRSSKQRINRFQEILENNNISVTQRVERGSSESSACGQLRRQETRKRSPEQI